MSRKKISSKNLIAYSILFLFVLFVFIPLYWMVVGSLQLQSDMFMADPKLIPRRIITDNYLNLFQRTKIITWFMNSLIISAGSVAIGLFISTLTGYLFSIYKFKGKALFFWFILASVTIPEIVLIIPTYRILISAGLLDTYYALILPYAMSVFGVFFMKQFMQVSVPMELIECARMEGAGEFLIYYRIALPLSATGIGVLSVYLWLNSWINYFWPLIMIRSSDMFTLPLGLATLYADTFNTDYGQLMAGSVVATIPLVVLFLFIQEKFVAGMTAGAVKDM